MDVKVIESINIEKLTNGFTVRVHGRAEEHRHSDWATHSEAFSTKKEMIKFIENLGI